MQDSHARSSLSAVICCSGVEKSPESLFRLLTIMSGCSSKTILFVRSDSQPAASSGHGTSYHNFSIVAEQFAKVCVDVLYNSREQDQRILPASDTREKAYNFDPVRSYPAALSN